MSSELATALSSPSSTILRIHWNSSAPDASPIRVFVAGAAWPFSWSTTGFASPVSQCSMYQASIFNTSGLATPGMFAALIFSAAARSSSSVVGGLAMSSPAAAKCRLLKYSIGVDTANPAGTSLPSSEYAAFTAGTRSSYIVAASGSAFTQSAALTTDLESIRNRVFVSSAVTTSGSVDGLPSPVLYLLSCSS